MLSIAKMSKIRPPNLLAIVPVLSTVYKNKKPLLDLRQGFWVLSFFYFLGQIKHKIAPAGPRFSYSAFLYTSLDSDYSCGAHDPKYTPKKIKMQGKNLFFFFPHFPFFTFLQQFQSPKVHDIVDFNRGHIKGLGLPVADVPKIDMLRVGRI